MPTGRLAPLTQPCKFLERMIRRGANDPVRGASQKASSTGGNLVHPDQRTMFVQATEAMRLRLDIASKTIAAQEFRHTVQREAKTVSDFIHRLERMFCTAYGCDAMSVETKDTLLYGQMQERLCFWLMRGPAVSGAGIYQELCIAARNEEKHLADLKRRQ